MYPVPLEWRVVAVPLVPPEPWFRHWALPGGIVASHGSPGGMYVLIPLGDWFEALGWALLARTPAPPGPLPELW